MTMARRSSFFLNGHYHVYNRGHNKEPIFLNYKDYSRYMHRLEEYVIEHPVTILAYCLMPNHIHFLLRQDGEEPIDKFIHHLHTAYTKYFNIKYHKVGAVFQGPFKAKLIESDEYLLHVSRYIHLNPIDLFQKSYSHWPGAATDALNSQLIDYQWSSYKYYIHSAQNNNEITLPSRMCDTSIIQGYFSKTYKKLSYQSFVEDSLQTLLDTPQNIEKINNGYF